MNNVATKSLILEKVRSLAASEVIDKSSIKFDTRIFENKILNSVTLLELMDFLEIELGIDIDESKLSIEFFESVNEIEATFLGGLVREGK